MNKINQLLLLILLTVFSAQATKVITDCVEEGTPQSESESYDEDYLYMGKRLHFSGEAEDLYYLGKNLDFSGRTKLGIFAGGENINVSGSAGNGVLAACVDLTIKGHIKGTNFWGSEDVWIHEGAVVDGDIFAGCGQLTIDGTVSGNLYIGAGKVTINNTITGDLKVYGGRIIFGPQGKIDGDLTYATKEKLSKEDEAKVTGTVIFDEDKSFKDAFDFPDDIAKKISIAVTLFFFGSFLIGGTLLLFIPASKALDKKETKESFKQKFLWGLIPLLMYLAVFIILIVLIITIPLAFLLLMAAFPLFFITQVIGTTILGQVICRALKWKIKKRHLHFYIGAIVGLVLSMIPVINILNLALCLSLGSGVLVIALFINKSNISQEIATAEGSN